MHSRHQISDYFLSLFRGIVSGFGAPNLWKMDNLFRHYGNNNNNNNNNEDNNGNDDEDDDSNNKNNNQN
jgi:hypothetical protein